MNSTGICSRSFCQGDRKDVVAALILGLAFALVPFCTGWDKLERGPEHSAFKRRDACCNTQRGFESAAKQSIV